MNQLVGFVTLLLITVATAQTPACSIMCKDQLRSQCLGNCRWAGVGDYDGCMPPGNVLEYSLNVPGSVATFDSKLFISLMAKSLALVESRVKILYVNPGSVIVGMCLETVDGTSHPIVKQSLVNTLGNSTSALSVAFGSISVITPEKNKIDTSVCATIPKRALPPITQVCLTSTLFQDVGVNLIKCETVACQCVSGNSNSFVNGRCTVSPSCDANHLACLREYSVCQTSQVLRLKGDAQCDDVAVQLTATAAQLCPGATCGQRYLDSLRQSQSCSRVICDTGAGWMNSMNQKTPCSKTEIDKACAYPLSDAGVARISGAVFALAMVVLAMFG